MSEYNIQCYNIKDTFKVLGYEFNGLDDVIQHRSMYRKMIHLDECSSPNSKPYTEVAELSLPTLEDFEELYHHCMPSFQDNISKTVQFTALNGQRIAIDTKNYTPTNSNYRRLPMGEMTPLGTNMFWLKSEVKDDEARVAVLDTNNNTLYSSAHYVGYKLPFLLVKK